MDIHVRPATQNDLSQIRDIFAHYAEYTVSCFYCGNPPLSYIQTSYETATSRNLPFLVAVDSSVSQDTIVLGYIYILPFRERLAYAPSVECTIYTHHAYRRRGIGTYLLRSCLDELKLNSSATRGGTAGPSRGYVDGAPREGVRIRNVFAVMAHDVDGPDREDGEALMAWYVKSGFQVVGRLKHVGWKHDRWLDTVYLQLDLGC